MIVLNESTQAEKIIQNGEVGNKPTSTLFLLGKYYRQKKGLTKEQTEVKLNEFMQHNYKNYNSASWEDVIEDISKRANKFPLKEIDYIKITKAELEAISTASNIKYKKILFTMLCYAKYYNCISENNNCWVNADIAELYRIARVTVKHKIIKFLYLNDLEASGYISFSNKNDNLNMRVNFVNNDSETVLLINDCRELGYEYLSYVGDGKYIRCKRCGRLIPKRNNKHVYCKECSTYIKNEQNKRYYKNLGK